VKHLVLAAAALLTTVPAAAAPRRPQVTWLTVSMTDHGFRPRLINLRHGARYAIRFVNGSSRGHDFTAPDFFRTAQLDRDSAEKVLDHKIDLDPGEAATIRFTAPQGPGRFPFKSTHLTDAASGLSGYVLIR